MLHQTFGSESRHHIIGVVDTALTGLMQGEGQRFLDLGRHSRF